MLTSVCELSLEGCNFLLMRIWTPGRHPEEEIAKVEREWPWGVKCSMFNWRRRLEPAASCGQGVYHVIVFVVPHPTHTHAANTRHEFEYLPAYLVVRRSRQCAKLGKTTAFYYLNRH